MELIQCRKPCAIENEIAAKDKKRNAVALGNFDGLHLGHARLIEQITHRDDMRSYVYTFKTHPSKFISKDPSLVKTIIDNSQKLDILEQMGVDFVCLEEFESVKDMSPADFVKRILVDTLECDVAVCGYNFSFGAKGSGNSELLKKELAKYGRECIIVEPVTLDGTAVSSTRIRTLIENGALDEAAKLLGRPFSIRRPVIHGRMLGRTMGIPTVNQSFESDSVIPKNGVYACKVTLDGVDYPAVCNVGTKPTVNGTELLAETHIIGYNGELYGQSVEVAFFKRLRDEERFSNIDKLKSVIQNDIESAKRFFL